MNTQKIDALALCIEKWGIADSIALFDPRTLIFDVPGIPGMIGYRSEAGCAVVMGDPVCPPESMQQLTHAFHNYCKSRFKSVMYIMASQDFMRWALQQGLSKCAIAVGQEIIINPQCDIKRQQGPSIRRLRNKYNHALRSGVSIAEYTTPDIALENMMIHVCQMWQKSRHGVQIYHSEIDIFSQKKSKRWFYITHNNTMIGFLFLNRIYQGWVLNRFILLPQSPYGTSELAILSVLDILRAENCSFFSAGMTATADISETYGFGQISRFFIKVGFVLARRFLPLDGRQYYWEKFQPHKAPSFLLIDKSFMGPRITYGLLRAFNINFGHGPRIGDK